MEALRLLGGADGCDGESLIILPRGAALDGALAAARRADRSRVKAHVGGPRAARRRPWRVGVAESRRRSSGLIEETNPHAPASARTEACRSDGDS